MYSAIVFGEIRKINIKYSLVGLTICLWIGVVGATENVNADTLIKSADTLIESVDSLLKKIKTDVAANFETFVCLKEDTTDCDLQKTLSDNTSIEELNLANCSQIDFENSKLDWSNKLKLIKLDLSATKITKKALKTILSDCKNLKKLNVKDCKKLNKIDRKKYKHTEAIKKLMSKLSEEKEDTLESKKQRKKLKTPTKIDFSKTKNIPSQTDQADKQLAQLKTIKDSNAQIEAIRLQVIYTKCANLESLDLSNSTISDLHNFDYSNLSVLNNLKTLDFGNTNIDDLFLEKNIFHSPNLVSLNTTGCINLNAKLQGFYDSQEKINTLKKEMKQDLTSKKIVPQPISFKLDQPVAQWNPLLKYSLIIGSLTFAAIAGAVLIYKKAQSIQNISRAMWQRLIPLVKRTNYAAILTINKTRGFENEYKKI